MSDSNKVRIVLGDIFFSIITTDLQLINELKNHIVLSSNGSTPDITLRVDYLSSLNDDLGKKTLIKTGSDIGVWKKIKYGDKKIKGYFTWTDNKVQIFFETKVKPLSISYLFALFVSAFYIAKKGKVVPDIQDTLFLHAAGIVRDNYGYVFAGPSGSGKTTISRLSHHKSTVINDECIQLHQIKGEYWLSNTPLKSEFFCPDKIEKKLKYIFFLTKSNKHGLRKVRGAEAVMRLINSLVFPSNFSSNWAKAISEKLRLVSNLVNNVPCYELYFSKDDEFWSVITHLKQHIS